MIYKYLLIAFLSVLICSDVQSQQLSQDEIRKQLIADGVDEEEVRKRLVAQGYDPNNIDLNDPTQMAELQAATERIIQQIKAEEQSGVVHAAGALCPAA